jgi:hypothetical protein
MTANRQELPTMTDSHLFGITCAFLRATHFAGCAFPQPRHLARHFGVPLGQAQRVARRLRAALGRLA